jgi:hypothetical protein
MEEHRWCNREFASVFYPQYIAASFDAGEL